MYKPLHVDEYLSGFPPEVRDKLEQLRQTIKKVAPAAEEIISYGMPAYKQNGILLYFAGYKNHIGLYPMASGIENFKTEFKNYKWSKGTVQFPLDKPLPLRLITKIIKFRVNQNLQKSKLKKK